MTGEVQIVIHEKDGGEITETIPLIKEAIWDIEELTWNSTGFEAHERVARSIQENCRVEITAEVGGRVVGAIILVAEEDIHLGPLMSAQWFFVIPEFRGAAGSRLIRAAYKEAIALGWDWFTFSHRVSPGTYQINYRKL